VVNSRICETERPRFRNSGPRLKKQSRLREAKSPENDTPRPITNASEISRLGQNFPRPTFFVEPFYNPTSWVLRTKKISHQQMASAETVWLVSADLKRAGSAKTKRERAQKILRDATKVDMIRTSHLLL